MEKQVTRSVILDLQGRQISITAKNLIYSIIEFYINNELKHYINETLKKKKENMIVE